MRRIGWFVGSLLACGAPASPAPVVAPKPPAVGLPAPVALGDAPRLQVAPAALRFVTDVKWSRESQKVYPVGAGAVAYLDTNGRKALATLRDVRTIAGPEKLSRLCVAKDGKTTFAVLPGKDELVRGATFEGPMQTLGHTIDGLDDPREEEPGTASSLRPAWLVDEPSGSFALIDCASAEAHRIPRFSRKEHSARVGGTLQFAHFIMRSDKTGSPAGCGYLVPGASDFVSLAVPCEIDDAPNGGIVVNNSRGRPPKNCMYQIDNHGGRHACSLAKTDESQQESSRVEAGIDGASEARFYAPSGLVSVRRDGGLKRVSPRGDLLDARIGSAGLTECHALETPHPIFVCTLDENQEVTLFIKPDGSIQEESRRPKMKERTIHATTNGGVALAGACDGSLGELSCVRDVKGAWHEVRFSSAFNDALARSAPATLLLPHPSGALFAFVGATSAGRRFGPAVASTAGLPAPLAPSPDAPEQTNLRAMLFRTDSGEPVAINGLPGWILEKLALVASGELRRYASIAHPVVTWRDASHVRIWPLERLHPAFKTPEACGVEFDLTGKFTVDCTQGRLSADGPFALLEKRPGELFETVDAGVTWANIGLPAGVETTQTECLPMGCAIGPYFREGWGKK